MAPVPNSASQNDRLAEELIYRERQHDLLACFGMTALKSTDVNALLQEATRLCAEGLRTPLCKALERGKGARRRGHADRPGRGRVGARRRRTGFGRDPISPLRPVTR